MNKYTEMQRNAYNLDASKWGMSDDAIDHVVGSFNAHNAFIDYDKLFSNQSKLNEKICLDFGCGPGRNLVKYKDTFKRIDGVDISEVNINNAKLYTSSNGITECNLYINNGINIDVIKSNTYDIVMSTITLQHICVYNIRKSIITDIFRVLKSGGCFTAQMGFGYPSVMTVGYYENFYDATTTNRGCDVCIENADQLKDDLYNMGFVDFNYEVTNVGPGDAHPNWIFFNVKKP